MLQSAPIRAPPRMCVKAQILVPEPMSSVSTIAAGWKSGSFIPRVNAFAGDSATALGLRRVEGARESGDELGGLWRGRNVGSQGTAADPLVRETRAQHGFRIEEIPTIHDERIAHSRAHLVVRQYDQLAPFGDDHGGIRTGNSFEEIFVQLDVGKEGLGVLDRHRVPSSDARTLGQQARGEHEAASFPHVVRVWLEGESEERDRPVAETAEVRPQLPDDASLLELVHLDHRRQELEVIARVACQLLEGGDVLGKAGAAVADAGAQEVRPDAAVEAHPTSHEPYVCSDFLADVRDFVNE